jgi:hypothetical protein
MADETISLDQLQTGSLIERLAKSSPGRVEPVHIRGTHVHVARIADVLYLPDSHIQIVDGALVPLEANSDGLALGIMQDFAKKDEVRSFYQRSEFEYADIEACVLSNIFSESFFHWMEELYKVTILEKSGFHGYYICHSLPEYTVGWIDLLGIGADRIIRRLEGPTIFRSALFTTAMGHVDVLSYPGVFHELRGTILQALRLDQPTPGSGKRLWLERGANTFGGARRIVNLEEVQRCYARYGFQSIDLGALPAREQVAAVHSAEVLAGPHGAAFVHAMWLREHSIIVECFSPEHNNPSIFEICRVLGHRYFQMVHHDTPWEPYPHGGDVSIDLSHLQLTLEEIDRS